MKEVFYFIRDKDHKPVISVCLLLTTDGTPTFIVARGVAICSDKDTPCTKLHAHQSNGPGIARRRAWKAWKSGGDKHGIHREEAFKILDRVRFNNSEIWKDILFPRMFTCKAFHYPILSPKETRILTKVKL